MFLGVYVPLAAKITRMDSESWQARQVGTHSELRDLVSLAYVQANQKNYGIAARTAARFFNRVREVTRQTPDPNVKKTFEDLLITRDKVTAKLARGDAGVMADLQDLFMGTRRVTGISAEQ